MKKLTLLILTLLLTAALGQITAHAQDDSPQWLPEGAIARLGKGRVADILFSEDSTRLVVASSVGVWHYDARTGEEVNMIPWEMRVPGGRAVFSPDGTTLAVSRWHDIRLLDTQTGKQLKYLEEPTGAIISSLAFSADGRTLASGTRDRTVRLWDVVTGETRHTFTVVTDGWVDSVAFSPDGQTLATSGRGGTIRLWDAATGTLQNTLEGHSETDWVRSVAFSPDGQTLASAGFSSKTIRLWDVQTGESLHTLELRNTVYEIAFSPDGQTLASGTWRVRLWDVQTGESLRNHNGHPGRTGDVGRVVFSPDGQTLASIDDGGYLQLWDAHTGEPLHTYEGHTTAVKSVVFSPDGQTLARVGYFSKTLRLWDAHTREPLHTFERRTSRFDSVAFSPDGQTLANWELGDPTFHLWDVATGEPLHLFDLSEKREFESFDSVAFSPDGQTLASGSSSGTIWLWDAHTGESLHTWKGHTSWVDSVAFSPDGQTLASSSYWPDSVNHIRLWDVPTGQLRATLTGHETRLKGFAFSPDGTTLISTGTGFYGRICVWDVRSGKQIQVLDVPCSPESSPVFSPDGRFFAVGESLNGILLIDPTTEKIIGSFPGNTTSTITGAISPDGTTLASGGYDGTVILWDLTPFTSTEQLPEEHSEPEQLPEEHSDSVRVVYFQPSDREYQSGINARLETLIEDVQQFYAEQMETHRHGGKTVTFDEGFGVYHFTGKFTDAYYQTETYDKVQKEISEYFYQSKNVYLVAIDISSEVINDDGTCGVGGGQWWNSSFAGEAWHRDLGGLAVIPASGDCFNVGVAAHELGHAIGLDHDFRDDTYLMAYGSQQRLSREAAAWLDASRLFNPSQPDLGLPATLEMLSAGAGQLRFQVTDADGLHQAQLLIPTTSADPAQGTKLHSGKALNGDSSSIVAFAVPELTSGAAVTLQVIDEHGNIAKQTFSIEGEIGAPASIAEDVNEDGVVNFADVSLAALQLGEKGENRADVNGDGVVDFADLLLIAAALDDAAAAPSQDPQALEMFTAAEVQQWLKFARQLALTEPAYQRGIAVLEQLLAILTPKETVLLANYPNPFNPETWLPYQLAEPSEVVVTVYSSDGRLVRTLALGHQPAGVYQSRYRAAYWDGRNAQGEPVASGVYFYTLSVGEFSATRKMVMRK